MVKTIVLKLRDVIAILTENGFVALPQKGTSHIQYRGTIDGQTRVCTVDTSIADWVWKSHMPR
ncbi:MAG TPA: type II toxin-antitoxin system HicA family toxin [Thermomicrobiales bacterium]|nr:type II toxin-antitoxin system HicA family toxin [Thermomicrobiales bacterium]